MVTGETSRTVGWLKRTSEPGEQSHEWETLAKKFIDHMHGEHEVPEWASTLTCAIDRQKDSWVFIVIAWGPEFRHHVVSYGISGTLTDIREKVLARWYPHKDGGSPVQIAFTLIDNGYSLGKEDNVVTEFCIDCNNNHGMPVFPCKGASSELSAEYRPSEVQDGIHKGLSQIMVDGSRTQGWLEKVIHILATGDNGSATIFDGTPTEHENFLKQLLNEELQVKATSTNHDREVWNRISRSIGNDYRDCWRYAYVAALVHLQGRKPLDRKDTAGRGTSQDNQSTSSVLGNMTNNTPERSW